MRYGLAKPRPLRSAVMAGSPVRLGRLALALALATSALLVIPASAAASDTPTCMGLEASPGLLGTAEDDVIEGTPEDDVIIGLGGKDIIYGNGGNDIICGGGARDQIFGGPGNDILFGQGSNDVIKGGLGDDILKGGKGNDRLRGQAGEDVTRGGMGADVCVAESEFNCEMDDRGPRPEEEWQPLVEMYFPLEQVRNALDIIDCESNGDPFAVGPSGSPDIVFLGLFQHHSSYWAQRAINAGFPGETAFHPEANIAAAYDLWSIYGWNPWPWCADFYGLR